MTRNQGTIDCCEMIVSTKILIGFFSLPSPTCRLRHQWDFVIGVFKTLFGKEYFSYDINDNEYSGLGIGYSQ